MRFRRPQELSKKQLKKGYDNLTRQLDMLKKRDGERFKLIFLLSINLYKICPGHEIFNNGTLKEEFVEMVKKSVEKVKTESPKPPPADKNKEK